MTLVIKWNLIGFGMLSYFRKCFVGLKPYNVAIIALNLKNNRHEEYYFFSRFGEFFGEWKYDFEIRLMCREKKEHILLLNCERFSFTIYSSKACLYRCIRSSFNIRSKCTAEISEASVQKCCVAKMYCPKSENPSEFRKIVF